MLIVWVSASSTGGLIANTAIFREFLGATATSDDAAQASALRRASAWAEGRVHYPLLAQVYRETVVGYRSPRLMLSRTPIRSVFGLYQSTVSSSGVEILSSDYRIEDAEAGIVSLVSDANFLWAPPQGGEFQFVDAPMPGQEQRNYMARYEAGFVAGGIGSTGAWGGTTSTVGQTTSTAATLPADIEEAVLLRAQRIYEDRIGISSRRVGDLSLAYTTESSGSMAAEEKLLAPYQRYAV